jgi:hypothetical protein
MDITAQQIFHFNWWKHEYNHNLQQHQVPGIVLGATAILVNGIWGKQAAVIFGVVTFLAYPFAHRAIIYLISIQMHELVYAVAMVTAQFVGYKYPFFSEPALFMSLLFTASIAIHGSQTRDLLQKMESKINKLQPQRDPMNHARLSQSLPPEKLG